MVNLNTTIRNLTKILCGTYLSCDEKEDQKYVGFKGETSDQMGQRCKKLRTIDSLRISLAAGM